MTKNSKNDTAPAAQTAPRCAAPDSMPEEAAQNKAVVFLKYAIKILVTAGIVAVLVYTSKKHGTFDGVDFSGLN